MRGNIVTAVHDDGVGGRKFTYGYFKVGAADRKTDIKVLRCHTAETQTAYVIYNCLPSGLVYDFLQGLDRWCIQ